MGREVYMAFLLRMWNLCIRLSNSLAEPHSNSQRLQKLVRGLGDGGWMGREVYVAFLLRMLRLLRRGADGRTDIAARATTDTRANATTDTRANY